jgi:hypothetical protein
MLHLLPQQGTEHEKRKGGALSWMDTYEAVYLEEERRGFAREDATIGSRNRYRSCETCVTGSRLQVFQRRRNPFIAVGRVRVECRERWMERLLIAGVRVRRNRRRDRPHRSLLH